MFSILILKWHNSQIFVADRGPFQVLLCIWSLYYKAYALVAIFLDHFLIEFWV